jgi:hypothetical protein
VEAEVDGEDPTPPFNELWCLGPKAGGRGNILGMVAKSCTIWDGRKM